MNNKSQKMNILLVFLFEIIILAGIYLTSLYSFLVFHSIVELFTISIAFSLFMIAWNTKDLSKNSFFLIFGIASLFVGFFDLLHTLSYKGMNIFTGYPTNLPTQLWILARYMKSISLFIAFLTLNKKINEKITFLLYLTISFLFLISIFYLRIFPDCYIEGKGLTPFKIISEYIISIIFLFSLLFLFLNKKDFDKKVFYYIFFSIIVTILREFFFTLYVDVFGIFNLIGHFLKLISYYLIYKAFY